MVQEERMGRLEILETMREKGTRRNVGGACVEDKD